MSFNYSTSMFIGTTTRGIEMPVFFDTHTPIFNNKPPGIVITGQPGSGKSFLAMTLTNICAIIGKTTIVLDPKGDFLGLQELKKDIGNFNSWDLSRRDKKGILDPFFMASTDNEKLELVLNVIELFIGGWTDHTQLTILSPIVKDVIQEPAPSLLRVRDKLLKSDKPVARNLGAQLDIISKMKFAELCFAPGSRERTPVSFNQGLTVVTMVGLELTPENEKNSGTNVNSNKRRLAATIFYLLTDFIRRIMEDDTSNNPKCLIIDEAWAVLSTSAGSECVRSVALLGRSKNLAMILITQNDSHLKNLDIENTITTRFAFRTDQREAKDIVQGMNLPQGEGFEDVLIDLNNGECLMKDFENRYSTVQISDYKKDWIEAFKTNPLDKMKKRNKRLQTTNNKNNKKN